MNTATGLKGSLVEAFAALAKARVVRGMRSGYGRRLVEVERLRVRMVKKGRVSTAELL